MKDRDIALIVLSIYIIGLTVIINSYYFYNKTNEVEKIYLDKNNIVNVKLSNNNETYCHIGDEINDHKWIRAKDGKCRFKYSGDYNIYIKNKYNNTKVYKNIKKLNYLKNFTVKTKKIYLAPNDKINIDMNLDVIGSSDFQVKYTSNDPNIAIVNDKGIINSIRVGKTEITVDVLGETETIDVIVTDKIVKKPNEYPRNKPLIPCNYYTKEENDLLDDILKTRVNDAGYMTRGGVVAAARFIGLEFPFRIPYFFENGRLETFNIASYSDGEGRYYHEGLYLNNSRFSNIVKSSMGPKTWGCDLYSYTTKRMDKNGFDCSGYITWILKNGGFDPKDIGAGLTYVRDLTDIGTKKILNNSIDTIKSGDLLSGRGNMGGHIALLAGKNGNDYYVSESIWHSGYYGAVIRKYDRNSLLQNFYWHIDMDDYYKNDGIYSEYWN